MSMQFRFPTSTFVNHDDIRLFGGRATEHSERKPKEKCNKPLVVKSPPLRDSHIVLLAVDVLVALHAASRKWLNHRRTLKALEELDEHQLRDIGLAREQVSDGRSRYRPLAGADDPSGPTETKSGLLQTPGSCKADCPNSAYCPLSSVMCSDGGLESENVKRYSIRISPQHFRQGCGTDPHGQECRLSFPRHRG